MGATPAPTSDHNTTNREQEPMMNRMLTIGVATVTVLASTTAALAQDGGEGSTWAEMFLLPPNPMGKAIVWLLVLMSAMSIGFALKFAVQYRKSMMVPDETREELEALLGEKKYRDAIEYAQGDDSFLAKVAGSALGEAANGYGAMERAIEEQADTETGRMLRPIEYLNVLGNISPMIGLFGTVYGMIWAFQQLVAAGGSPDPSKLAGGISTALVTTFWGLVVAIPALAAYSLIRNRVDAMTSEGILVAEELIAPFKPGKKGGGGGSSRQRATPKPEAGQQPEQQEGE